MCITNRTITTGVFIPAVPIHFFLGSFMPRTLPLVQSPGSPPAQPGARSTAHSAALHLGQRNVKGSSVRNAHHSESIIDSHFMPIFPFNR